MGVNNLPTVVKLKVHDADTDTDTDTDTDSRLARHFYTSLYVRHARHPREDLREEIACVGRKTVAVFGESVSVSLSVSAPWNASFRQLRPDQRANRRPFVRRSDILPLRHPRIGSHDMATWTLTVW